MRHSDAPRARSAIGRRGRLDAGSWMAGAGWWRPPADGCLPPGCIWLHPLDGDGGSAGGANPAASRCLLQWRPPTNRLHPLHLFARPTQQLTPIAFGRIPLNVIGLKMNAMSLNRSDIVYG